MMLEKDLLFDTETHMSLGSILYDLKINNKYTNLLLDRLQIGRTNTTIDKEGKIPTDINYFNATTLEMDEEVLLNTFLDMIINDKEIGQYNNEILTTKILADKLITHQVITGGLQKSQQFIKYIPYSYLNMNNFYNNLKDLAKVSQDEVYTDTLTDLYRTQYIQHNPEEYYDNTISDYEVKNGVLLFTDINKIPADNFGNQKDIIVIKDDRFRIFKFNIENSQYIEIDRLGWNSINEYSFENGFAGKSNIWINKNEYDNNDYIELPTDTETSNFLHLDRDTSKDNSPKVYNTSVTELQDKYHLTNNNISIEEKYKLVLNDIKDNSNDSILSYFSSKLLEVTPYLADVPLYLDLKINAKGKTYSLKTTKQPIKIAINTNNISNENDLQRVLIEEITHAVLKKELNNNISTFTKEIEQLRQDTISFIKKEYGEEKYNNTISKIENEVPLPLEKNIERDLIYNTYNIDEFVAGIITNKNFQQYLNNKTSTKSIWSKIVDFY